MYICMKASDFLKHLSILDKEDLINIKGIGEVLADNYLEFIESQRYQDLIEGFESLENSGRAIEITQTIHSRHQHSTLPLSGETIVITGSFDIPRNDIKTILESKGAKVTSAVTSSTTIVLAGEKAGSKLSKAEQLGIRIADDYREFL